MYTISAIRSWPPVYVSPAFFIHGLLIACCLTLTRHGFNCLCECKAIFRRNKLRKRHQKFLFPSMATRICTFFYCFSKLYSLNAIVHSRLIAQRNYIAIFSPTLSNTHRIVRTFASFWQAKITEQTARTNSSESIEEKTCTHKLSRNEVMMAALHSQDISSV